MYAHSLILRLNAAGYILGVHWIASSDRLVHAMWYDYKPLAGHFESTSNDPNRDSTDKATYKGLKMSLIPLLC